MLLGTTLSGSVAASRLFELVPFSLVFLFPFLALANVGSVALGPVALLTGLNSVLVIAAVLRDGAGAALLYGVVLLANLGWVALALEWAARRAAADSFVSGVSSA